MVDNFRFRMELTTNDESFQNGKSLTQMSQLLRDIANMIESKGIERPTISYVLGSSLLNDDGEVIGNFRYEIDKGMQPKLPKAIMKDKRI